jgi:hypothetical protein
MGHAVEEWPLSDEYSLWIWNLQMHEVHFAHDERRDGSTAAYRGGGARIALNFAGAWVGPVDSSVSSRRGDGKPRQHIITTRLNALLLQFVSWRDADSMLSRVTNVDASDMAEDACI